MSKIVGVTVGTPLSISRIKREVAPEIKKHEDNKENPHGVTKDQVGLGKVDNTSDAEKPVSAAQAQAIAEAKKAAENAAENANAAAANAQSTADNALPKTGGVMTGTIVMSGFPIRGVLDPSDDMDAVNKKYVDSTYLSDTVVLTTAGWMGSNAPYAQSVDMIGILATDNPHFAVVYSGNQAQKLAQKEAFAMVDDLETEDGKLTFTCFEDKPNVELTVQIEVNRMGISESAVAIMMLNMDEGAQTDVMMDIEGTTYGVRNATINSEPTTDTYDFTVT